MDRGKTAIRRGWAELTAVRDRVLHQKSDLSGGKSLWKSGKYCGIIEQKEGGSV